MNIAEVPWPFCWFWDDVTPAQRSRAAIAQLEAEASPKRRQHLTSLLSSPLLTDQAAVHLLGKGLLALCELGVPYSKLKAKWTLPGEFPSACSEIVATARLADVTGATAVSMDWLTTHGSRPDVRITVGTTEYIAEYKGLRPSHRESRHRATAARWAAAFNPARVGGGHCFFRLKEPWTEYDSPSPLLADFKPPGERPWRLERGPEAKLDLCGWTVAAPADLDHEVARFRARFDEAATQLPKDRPGMIVVQRHDALPADLCADAMGDAFDQFPHVAAGLLTVNLMAPALERFDLALWPKEDTAEWLPLTPRAQPHSADISRLASYNDYRAYRYWALGSDGEWHVIADNTASNAHASPYLPVTCRLLSIADEEHVRPPRPFMATPVWDGRRESLARSRPRLAIVIQGDGSVDFR